MKRVRAADGGSVVARSNQSMGVSEKGGLTGAVSIVPTCRELDFALLPRGGADQRPALELILSTRSSGGLPCSPLAGPTTPCRARVFRSSPLDPG
jgi:hypothetical protein